jgi:cell cycle arrest protein BUB3
MLDINRGSSSTLNSHGGSVSCMQFCAYSNTLYVFLAYSLLLSSSALNRRLSGSWDGTMIASDSRTASRSLDSTKLDGKIYSLSVCGSRAVVASSLKQIHIFDLRFLSGPEQIRESPLKHQLRKVACSPEGNSFTVSSVEGRVGIEYFNTDPSEQSRKYQFKCHRVGDLAYPINAIEYHPVYGKIV